MLASDGKWEDYAAIVVTVVNKNDEAPVFSMSEYYGSVTEELDGSPVFVLQVRVWQDFSIKFWAGFHGITVINNYILFFFFKLHLFSVLVYVAAN